MKKKIASVLLILLLLVCLLSPAFAATVGKIRDDVGALRTSDLRAYGISALPQIAKAYDFDLRVVFTEAGGHQDLQEYADSLYDSEGYGLGDDKEGILLAVFTDGKADDGTPYIYDYSLILSGERQELFFANDGYEGDQLVEAILDALDTDTLSRQATDLQDRYAGMVMAFAQQVERVLAKNAGTANAVQPTTQPTAVPSTGNTRSGNTSTGSNTPANSTTGQTTAQTASGLLPAGTDTTSLVMDAANLLTDAERQSLEQKALRIAEKYGCDPLIVTVNSMGGYSAARFTEALYSQYELGQGSAGSCVMLMVSMGSRDYDLMAHGYGNTAFTDYGKQVMENRFVPYLSQGAYYTAFDLYLSDCEELLAMAAEGEPFDYGTDPEVLASRKRTHQVTGVALGIGLPGLIALIACQGMKSQMKTVRKQTTAGRYVTAQGLNLTRREDHFLRTATTRTRIQSNNGSSGGHGGGGGGTHVNSGGFSHSSGKF